MAKDVSDKEIADIIVETIKEENYFTKEVLIPKIRAVFKIFRIRLNATNYNKILSPSETAKLIRANEMMNLERQFWKDQLIESIGKENAGHYYQKLDSARESWQTTH